MAHKDIVLVHGIRTHARWYETVRRIFRDIPDSEVHPVKYGRFDLFRFLVPGPWRNGPKRRIEAKLRPILRAAEKASSEVTIICHSNGTKVVTDILLEQPDLQIRNLIMCGSVVSDEYDWNRIANQISGEIVNEYGVKDMWPAVARSVSWGYGYSGTNGFGAPVIDRMHDAGHSTYFSAEFIEKYWRPFIANGTIIESEDAANDSLQSPGWFAIFELPLRWLVVLALAGLLALLFLKAGSITDRFARFLPAPAIGQQGYVYYETDRAGNPTEQSRLDLFAQTRPLPLASGLHRGAILVVTGDKPLRKSATRSASSRIMPKHGCLSVIDVQRSFQPDDAASGGWVRVAVSACPR